MGDLNGEPVARESVVASSAAPPQPHGTLSEAPEVQDQAPAVQVPALAQALADEAQAQAPVPPDQAPAVQVPALAQALADEAQAQARVAAAQAQAPVPPDRAQALLAQAHALLAQAQVLADQVQALLAPSNDFDAAEKKAFAYKEIANLHSINSHYPIHKLALEEWQRREKYLSDSESRREGRSAEVKNQIYNIFGWLAVFQGVVLTAVSQLTQTADTEEGGAPLCGKIWFPIVLSVFATVATIVGISRKFTKLQSLEDTIHSDKQARAEVSKRALSLRSEGPQKFKFNLNADNSSDARKAKSFWNKQLLVIVFLVIFLGIFILSYFVILCDTWVVREWDGGFPGRFH